MASNSPSSGPIGQTGDTSDRIARDLASDLSGLLNRLSNMRYEEAQASARYGPVAASSRGQLLTNWEDEMYSAARGLLERSIYAIGLGTGGNGLLQAWAGACETLVQADRLAEEDYPNRLVQEGVTAFLLADQLTNRVTGWADTADDNTLRTLAREIDHAHDRFVEVWAGLRRLVDDPPEGVDLSPGVATTRLTSNSSRGPSVPSTREEPLQDRRDGTPESPFSGGAVGPPSRWPNFDGPGTPRR